MEAKTFKAKYKVIDFNLYLSEDKDRNETISVVDFVVEGEEDVGFIEKEFNNMFVIDNDKVRYLFADYELNECYEVGDGLIRVICIK